MIAKQFLLAAYALSLLIGVNPAWAGKSNRARRIRTLKTVDQRI